MRTLFFILTTIIIDVALAFVPPPNNAAALSLGGASSTYFNAFAIENNTAVLAFTNNEISLNAYYRYRIETKQSTLAGGNIKQLANETLGRHRVHINYVVTKGVSLRSRIEWNRYQEGNSQSAGSLVYQDIIFKPFGRSLQLSGRIAYGRIEQFQNRIYSFEQTPLYDYPLFTHGFTGLRFYALASYKVAQNVDLWFRYAHTQHDVPLTMLTQDYAIGSGLEKITGNKRQTFTLQIRYIIK